MAFRPLATPHKGSQSPLGREVWLSVIDLISLSEVGQYQGGISELVPNQLIHIVPDVSWDFIGMPSGLDQGIIFARYFNT